MDESSQEVLAPPVKRKRRRRKRTVPKTDEGISEATPQPADESGVALFTAGETGKEKEDMDETTAAVEEEAQKNTMDDESSFAVSSTEDFGLKEMASSSSVPEEANVVNLTGSTAHCANAVNTDKEMPIVTETPGASDKEKHTKTSVEDVPVSSTNTPVSAARQEAPRAAPTEVKKSPLIPRYSRFEFLANSMIITDVTTERGTVTVKECSAYEGFYGPEPDRPS